jgi:hypothetical protein
MLWESRRRGGENVTALKRPLLAHVIEARELLTKVAHEMAANDVRAIGQDKYAGESALIEAKRTLGAYVQWKYGDEAWARMLEKEQ